jgi:hypothetical protein
LWTVYLLDKIMEFTDAEIGEILNLTPGRVKERIGKARRMAPPARPVGPPAKCWFPESK